MENLQLDTARELRKKDYYNILEEREKITIIIYSRLLYYTRERKDYYNILEDYY